MVVCRSQHEKGRVIHGLGIKDNKVEIVLNGTHIPNIVSTDKEELRRKYDLPDKYVLHVSAYTDTRKNIIRLVQAVTELGCPLIITGNAIQNDILDELNKLTAGNENIRLMGFIQKDMLDALYACCRVFCLPSIHEGTGLVALEAGIRGANVVITENGGPPDYFDKFVEYVKPHDVTSIKDAVSKAWNKPESSELVDHINNSLKWKDSAATLLSIISETYCY